MRVNCPSVYVGATFRPVHTLPNKAGEPAPAPDVPIQEGKVFTVTAVEDQEKGSTRVTLSNGTRTIHYDVETLLRGFSTIA